LATDTGVDLAAPQRECADACKRYFRYFDGLCDLFHDIVQPHRDKQKRRGLRRACARRRGVRFRRDTFEFRNEVRAIDGGVHAASSRTANPTHHGRV